MNAPLPLATVNALPAAEFAARFGAVFEHAPWVAEAAARARPFASAEALAAAMFAALRAGGTARLDALLRAHPELGGAAARAGRLTPASTE
ncbi:MAG: 2-oxo-4-hydroxy-4-carboxy-5-ureidoimidazoline decarboxylase, partial [Acetobacteraceae bacterium]